MPFELSPDNRFVGTSLFDAETKAIVAGEGDPFHVLDEWAKLFGTVLSSSDYYELETILRGDIKKAYIRFHKLVSTDSPRIRPFLQALYAHACWRKRPSHVDLVHLPSYSMACFEIFERIVGKYPDIYRILRIYNTPLATRVSLMAVEASTVNAWHITPGVMPPMPDLRRVLSQREPGANCTRLTRLVALFDSTPAARTAALKGNLPDTLLERYRPSGYSIPLKDGLALAFHLHKHTSTRRTADEYIRTRLTKHVARLRMVSVRGMRMKWTPATWVDMPPGSNLGAYLTKASMAYYLPVNLFIIAFSVRLNHSIFSRLNADTLQRIFTYACAKPIGDADGSDSEDIWAV